VPSIRKRRAIYKNGKISFFSNRGGAGNRIYVWKEDGSAVKKLTYGKLILKSGEVVMASPDTNPVISPDGKRVAFVSRRSGDELKNSAVDIFMVNTDGTNLRQVTQSEMDRSSDAQVRVVTWSPDGKRLAYRGTRSVVDANGNAGVRDVLGFVDLDGSNPVKIVINDCGGGNVIDWVGDSILYTFGANVQGCPVTRYIVRSYSSGSAIEISPEVAVDATMNPGSARLSPDARFVKYSKSVNNGAVLVTVAVDGSKVTEVKSPMIAYGTWIWWSKENKLPAPYKYVVEPSSISVKVGKLVTKSLVARLTDKSGETLSVSGSDWTWVTAPNGTYITPQGVLTVNANASKGVGEVQISNAGKTAKMKIELK